jgi:hypothetical protein
MPEGPVQTYENHVRREPMVVTASLLCAIALIVAIIGVAIDNTRVVGAAVIVGALGGVLLCAVARSYAVKLQDRIIRLEMRLHLAEILPDDLKPRIQDLTLPQLIALRFASDEELPDLTRKVLGENIKTRDSIKKLIKNWQADWHRV